MRLLLTTVAVLLVAAFVYRQIRWRARKRELERIADEIFTSLLRDVTWPC